MPTASAYAASVPTEHETSTLSSMKPARFQYFAPESLGEALWLLGEHGDEAKVIAGGQSLLPLMNMRLAQPGVLVDICRIPGLDRIELNGSLTVGATARQIAIRRSADVSAFAPLIGQVMPHVGHVATQSRGTFGGIVAHADPAAELPAILLALDAEMVARGPDGERTIQASDFFSSFFTTTLKDDEILTHVRLPSSTGGARSAFLEIARRHGDFALVGVGAVADIGEDGAVARARIGMCGVGHVPIRAHAAEEFLAGESLDETSAKRAGELAAAELKPLDDVHASSLYRKDVAEVLVRRALLQLSSTEGT